MMTVIKALQHDKACFQCLKAIFPKISDAKINECIFVSHQICQLLDDEGFKEKIYEPWPKMNASTFGKASNVSTMAYSGKPNQMLPRTRKQYVTEDTLRF